MMTGCLTLVSHHSVVLLCSSNFFITKNPIIHSCRASEGWLNFDKHVLGQYPSTLNSNWLVVKSIMFTNKMIKRCSDEKMRMLTFKYHLIMTFKMTLLEISVLFTVENGVNLILNSFCHHVSPCLTLMNAIKEISNFIKIQLCTQVYTKNQTTGERRPVSLVNHIRSWNYMQKSKKQH